MRASPGLDRHFDAAAAVNRKDINRTLKNIEDEIHPVFKESFIAFRKDLKKILKNHPVHAADDNIAVVELEGLHKSIKKSNGKYSIKAGAAILDDLA